MELFENLTRQGAPLGYTAKYEVTLQRPDKLRVLKPADGPANGFYYDGKSMMGYAPAEKPQIIVSVLLGNPENWHLRGHEAARHMIERALSASRDGEDHDDTGEAPAKPRRKRHR